MTSEPAPDNPAARDASPDRPTDEGREGPVREKLEETRIDEAKRQSLELNAGVTDADMKEVLGSSDDRGRLRKKRSFDDIGDDESKGDTKHTRKRSRELEDKQRPSKKEKADIEAAKDLAESEEQTSAPTKDSEAQHKKKFDNQLAPAESTPNKPEEQTKPVEQTGPEDPSKPAESATPPQVAASSGFANSSGKSPFASLNASKSSFASPQKTTNGGGFASSGFSSFAKSSASPFGALSPAKEAPEKEKQPSVEAPKEKLSFASAGSQPSGFGTLAGQKKTTFGSGLGSASPFAAATAANSASPLKSFASSANGMSANGLSDAKSTKLGDPSADDEDAEEEEDNEDVTYQVGTQTEEKQDDRFYEQDVETGEEGETIIFQERAKLYYLSGNAWKERGSGVFKINCKNVSVEVPATDESKDAHAENDDVEAQTERASKVSTRFVFRTDGSLRTMLNSPLTKDVTLSDRPGNNGKTKIFTGYIDGKPTPCLIQMSTPAKIDEFVQVVEAIKDRL